MRTIESMTELKKTIPVVSMEIINLASYNKNKRSGGGLFEWCNESNEDDDNGYCIKVDGISKGRWIRQVSDYLNYNMFGADDTGQDVADHAMLNAHSVANKLNIPIVQKTGVFYWKKETIDVYGSCDLVGATIKCDKYSGDQTHENGGPSVYRILSENKPIVLRENSIKDLNENYCQYMVKNSMYLPFEEIVKYKGSLVVIESSERDIVRFNDGIVTDILKKDLILTTKNGGLLIGFAKTFISGEIVKVTIIPKEDSVLYFRSPAVNCTETVSFKFIECLRSNTQITGVIHTEYGVDVSNRRMMVSAHMCDNVRLIDFELEALPEVNGVKGTYGLHLSCVTRTLLNNITGNEGWGVTGSNYIKNISVKNVFLNRFDCHWMAFDVTIINSTFKNQGVYLTGGGALTIRDCVFLLDRDPATNERPDPVFLTPRKDYAQEWDGTILIDGINIKISPDVKIYKLFLIKFDDIQYDPGRDVIWPSSINIKNIVIDGTSKTNNELFQAIILSLNPNITDDISKLSISCPNVVSVSDVYFYNFNVPSFCTAITWLGFASPTAKVVVNKLQHGASNTNCNITVKDIYQQPLNKHFMLNDWGGLIQIIESKPKWDPVWYRPENELALSFNVYVNNCQSAFLDFTAMGVLRVSDSTVLSVDNYSGEKAINCKVHVNNCVVYPVSRQKNKNQWFLGQVGSIYTNSKFVRPLSFSGVAATNEEMFSSSPVKVSGWNNFADSVTDITAYDNWVDNNFWVQR